MKISKYILIFIGTILLTAIASWIVNSSKTSEAQSPRDFEQIMESGELIVIVEDNKMSSYTVECDKIVECDTLEGLQVKMVEAFGKKHGLNITFHGERDLGRAIDKLKRDSVDVLIWHIPVYSDMKDSIAYTIPVFTSHQVLVQRRSKPGKLDSVKFIRNQLDLAGKDIYIVQGSIFKQRLLNLQKEMGDTINLCEIAGANDDQLFRMVSEGRINYFVCDEFVARVLKKEYSNVDISTAVSFTQNYSWGVSPRTPVLLDSLNSWLEVYLESKEYNRIYRKYTGVK